MRGVQKGPSANTDNICIHHKLRKALQFWCAIYRMVAVDRTLLQSVVYQDLDVPNVLKPFKEAMCNNFRLKISKMNRI